MMQRKCFFLYLLALTGHFMGHALDIKREKDLVSVTINTVADAYKEAVAHEWAEPFWVGSISIDSDVFIQENEILYLVGFSEGALVDASMLNKALYYLIKKNVFETICLSVKKGAAGCEVKFSFNAFWTLETVKIHGIWFGKDNYKLHYCMEPGEPFDINKHKDSVAQIKESVQSEGFLDPQIQDRLTYDNTTKGVRVDLTIHRGKQFTVSGVSLKVTADKQVDPLEQESVHAEIAALLDKRLNGKHYTKILMNKETANLKQMLVKWGFIHADIMLTETTDYAHNAVHASFSVDLHTKKEFIFFGNTFFTNKQLFETIMAFGRSAWMVLPSILAQEIETAYQNNGFWSVSVDAKEEVGRIFFVIKEGRRVSIKDIVLKNVINYSVQTLIKKYMSPLLALKYFDACILKKSIDALRIFYQDEGYFDAAVTEQERVELDDASGYRLVLTISEGARRYVRSVKFDQFDQLLVGCPHVDEIESKKRVACTRALIDKQRQWIEVQLKTQGFVNPRVKPELVPDGTMIDLIWHIDVSCANEQYGKTVLVGTRTVPFGVVARELEYTVGDPIKKEALKESLVNVKGLDIFDSAHIYPDQSRELGYEKPIMLKLYPADRFEIRMHAGMGLQQMRWPVSLDALTYKLGGDFIVNNPTNSGDQIRLNVDVTRIRRDIVASYIRPWVFGLPIRASFDAYSNKFEQQGFFCDRENWYEVFQQGFLTNLSGSKGLLNYSSNIGLEWIKMNIRKEYCCIEERIARAYAIDQRLLYKNIPYFFVEPNIMLDYLDQKLNPSYGSYTLFSCKAMAPLRDIRSTNPYLFRFLLEESVYLPFHAMVFAMRFRAGYIVGPKLDNILLNERFYLGGAHSLRSYYTDGTPPLGCFSDDNGCKHYVPQGGKGMLNASFEARFPIYAGLKGVLFQDFGALSHTNFSDIKPHGVLAGTGVGLLYNTPIGPLRFDIGWKWSCPEPFNRSYAWFLSLGQIF
jgi:outer membrane protein assembly factor BamA